MDIKNLEQTLLTKYYLMDAVCSAIPADLLEGMKKGKFNFTTVAVTEKVTQQECPEHLSLESRGVLRRVRLK